MLVGASTVRANRPGATSGGVEVDEDGGHEDPDGGR